ncbi:MAG: hypothetical protein EPO45_03820 [Sphingobium sp.]|nr:MAG: hypothetical protein EPO45_03820 [Sphingobium sp.]
MQINADFTPRATSHAATSTWVASPSGGVERRMLDRIGGEVARATTIVRFAPGSAFPAHTHGGGEEYFVIEGDFVDEEGSHKAGTYVRNPPGSRHAPSAPEGATIFVKLSQFRPDDLQSLSIDTCAVEGAPTDASRPPEHRSWPWRSAEGTSCNLASWRRRIESGCTGHGAGLTARRRFVGEGVPRRESRRLSLN